MGHAHSHDAFAAVLPADKASQSAKQLTKSASSAAVCATSSKNPGPKSLAVNKEQGESDSAPPNASVMRIQPPAHALLLHEDPLVGPARSSSGDDSVLTQRDHSDLDSGDTGDNRFLIPESVRKHRALDEFADVCSEILPNFLFVSNLQVATNAEMLQELGITHVTNCCKELMESCSPVAAAHGDGNEPTTTKVLNLALRDDAKEDLLWFFYQVIEFIQTPHSPPNKVLVHCHQGISRSCAFVIAYIMHRQSQQQQQLKHQSPSGFRDVLVFVKVKRPIASPNTAFLCQLIEWERELAAFSYGSSFHPEATGLYRLAPRAAHDPDTLVLKCCYTPGSQRQRVAANDSERGHYSPWLVTRGIFVFMRPSREITVWRDRDCEIPNGVTAAKALVEQMVRVRLGVRSDGQSGELAPFGVEIVEALEEEEDEDTGGGGDCLIDHFGYAEELSWLTSSSCPSTSSASLSSTNLTNAQELRVVTSDLDAVTTIAESLHSNSPPQLFILEDVNDEGTGGSWGQLAEYDSEDLTPNDAFLLLQPSKNHYFLWIGPDHTAFAPEMLVKCAQQLVSTLRCDGDGGNSGANGAPRGEASGVLRISITSEKGGEESDEFWTVFESGY